MNVVHVTYLPRRATWPARGKTAVKARRNGIEGGLYPSATAGRSLKSCPSKWTVMGRGGTGARGRDGWPIKLMVLTRGEGTAAWSSTTCALNEVLTIA